jgi:hypothetical protein
MPWLHHDETHNSRLCQNTATLASRQRGKPRCYHKGRFVMSKRTELIAKYAEDLKSKCKIIPDLSLLEKVTIGCGPAIYSADSETVAASDPAELETVKKNFLVKKLGLPDSPKLTEALNAVIDTYGRSERNKYRAVVYYMLVKHFGKEAVYA